MRFSKLTMFVGNFPPYIISQQSFLNMEQPCFNNVLFSFLPNILVFNTSPFDLCVFPRMTERRTDEFRDASHQGLFGFYQTQYQLFHTQY